MHGPGGSGKGTLAHLFGSFFGPHFQAVNSQEKLTGKFNRHLMEAQLVFADEVDFKDGGQASKTLRNLVTEPTLQIEFKGIDMVQMKKWFRIMSMPLIAVYFLVNQWWRHVLHKPFRPDYSRRLNHLNDENNMPRYNAAARLFLLIAQELDVQYKSRLCERVHDDYYRHLDTRIE